MNTFMWMQLLAVTLIAGAVVSKGTFAVLSRVGEQAASSESPEWEQFTGGRHLDHRSAARDLATLIDVEPSRIGVTYTEDHEVHCSIQADPGEIVDLATAAEVGIDQDFRDRHQWTGVRVILHLET